MQTGGKRLDLLKKLSSNLNQAPATKRFLKKLYHAPALKGFVSKVPIARKLYPMERADPIDAQYRIDTSGIMPVEVIHADKSLYALINAYCGSPPTVVRASLTALGKINDYVLVDLGCGKGRVTIVGSEFPFREVMGVELSGDLVRVAKKNALVIAHDFPDRPAIRIFEANVIEFTLPAGNLVLFFTHSFGRELLTQLVSKLEASLASELTHLFFVYVNPVCSDILDASPAFTRWYADTIRHDPAEAEFASDGNATVVIWQSVRGARPSPHPARERAVAIVGHDTTAIA